MGPGGGGGFQPSIILLREGTDTSQGKGQLISNINACQAVADVVRTTLGPRGMDKLIYEGAKATISNDGAEILKMLDIVHPAAKTMVDIARCQDAEVGDGTTSVTLIACELLKKSKTFIEDGEHPQIIIKGYRKAAQLAVQKVKDLSVGVADLNEGSEGRRLLLERCASTALNSKLICRNKDLFAPMCVQAVSCLDGHRSLEMIGIKKVTGGSVTESQLIDGVAFKKTFSYAGFEQQPKYIPNAQILVLNVELELKSEKDNAAVRIEDPAEYQSIVDAEWKIIYEKLENCVKTGANVILSKLPIGDLATQYFADRNIFCAGRVQDSDVKRLVRATKAAVQTSTNNIPADAVGSCGLFEEKQVGGERFNFLTGCPGSTSATIIIRGGSEQFVEEAHRSLHDALMIVKRSMESSTVVAGGGAIEMEVSRYLVSKARQIKGKQQLIMEAFAKALEVIPRQLSDNAGLDSTDMLNALRKKHFDQEGDEHKWFGVDINTGGICDTFETHVWEPAANKVNSIAAAAEAACLILSIDETVKNPQSEQAQMQKRGQMGGGGRGAPMSQAMGGKGMKGMMGRGRGIRMMKGKGGR